MKNTAPDNPMVRQQKILLYVFLLVFAIGGVNFPIGVLIYWFTTNLWSMGQQFYDQEQPQPGTPAFEAKEAARREGGEEGRPQERRVGGGRYRGGVGSYRHPVGKTTTQEDVAQQAQEEEVGSANLRGGRAL